MEWGSFLMQCNWCPYNKTAIGRPGEYQQKIEAQVGVMCYKPRNAQNCPQTTTRHEEARKDSHAGFRGNMPCPRVLHF